MPTLFLTAFLSIALNNNLVQVVGFIFVFILLLKNDATLFLFMLFAIVMAACTVPYDNTLLSAKIIILIFIIICLNSSIRLSPLLTPDSHSSFPYWMIACIFIANIVQYFYGVGSVGLFESIRLSALLWDPNYYALFVLLLYFYYKRYATQFFFLVIISQSMSSIISLLLYKLLPSLLLIFVLFVGALYFIFPFIFEEAYNFFDNQYIRDRLFSLNLRVGWAHEILAGDTLEGIAPHNSFFSGLKKNVFFTLLFFISIFIFSKNRKNLNVLLLLSMTNDVFFGPACFIIPFVLNVLPYKIFASQMNTR